MFYPLKYYHEFKTFVNEAENSYTEKKLPIESKSNILETVRILATPVTYELTHVFWLNIDDRCD